MSRDERGKREHFDALVEKKEKFLTDCLSAETPEEKNERDRFEHALTTIPVDYISRVSHELAARIYLIRFGIKRLFDKAVEGRIDHDEYRVVLALASELKDLEGKKGVIPTLETLRQSKIHIENRFEVLNYGGPDMLFVPIIEYLEDRHTDLEYSKEELESMKREIQELASLTERGQGGEGDLLQMRETAELAGDKEYAQIADEIDWKKRSKVFANDIVSAIEFSGRIYRWNTLYYEHNKDVGVLSPGGDYDKEKDVKGPHANYLIRWRGVPFAIYDRIVKERMLDYLTPSRRFDMIKNILAVMKNELLRRDYYNPAIFEEPPQTGTAIRVLGNLKEYYMLNKDEHPRVRNRIRNELRRLARHPDLAYPEEARELLRVEEEEDSLS
ncbi:hypothetical protein HYV71_01700 [Candidatus Uhrbacteria bacterium]|nr:hypothetical protein [Candidatus Uhrbacteria bacterium]